MLRIPQWVGQQLNHPKFDFHAVTASDRLFHSPNSCCILLCSNDASRAALWWLRNSVWMARSHWSNYPPQPVWCQRQGTLSTWSDRWCQTNSESHCENLKCHTCISTLYQENHLKLNGTKSFLLEVFKSLHVWIYFKLWRYTIKIGRK